MPCFIRSNIAEDCGKVGLTYGIELYWSFEHPQPGPSNCDGSFRLGKVQTITVHDAKKFSTPRLFLGMFGFGDYDIKLGFSYGTDFFSGGQLNNTDLQYANERFNIIAKVNAKVELRLNMLEGQFDRLFFCRTKHKEIHVVAPDGKQKVSQEEEPISKPVGSLVDQRKALF